MKLSTVITVCVSIMCIASACNHKEQNSALPVSDTALARQMIAPDDFDSTATEKKYEEEPEQIRYVAYSSNEAIELMNSLPEAEYYRQGILPRMSQECLDYAMRLLNTAHEGFMIVDKDAMKVALYDRYGREMLRYGIACGKGYGTKHRKGDSRTPEGFFSVEGIYDSTDWLFRDDNGRVSKVKGQFGPRFIRLKIPGTSQIGIHGTRAPGSIGARCSHGCIRVTNDNIMQLVQYVRPGMPVIVSPSRRDERVNIREGYDIPWVSVTNSEARRKPVEVVKPAPKPAVDSVEIVVPEPVDTVAMPAALPDVETETVVDEMLMPQP